MELLKKAGFFTFLIVIGYGLQSQEKPDTIILTRQVNPDQFVLPAALAAGSVILYAEPVKREIQRFFPNTSTHVDDWLVYAPAAELFAFDLMGFKHRNPVLVQAGNLALSQLIATTIVSTLKSTVYARRPSGGIHSYPSGHTNVAFVGATVLFLEFRETEPLLAWSGFAFAAATGLLRITNDAHWLPDVMAGAAVAMLVTRLVYAVEPFRKVGCLAGNNFRVQLHREENVNSVCLLFSF